MVLCRPGVARRHAGRAVAAADPEAQLGAAGRARLDGHDRLGAGVHPLPRDVRVEPRARATAASCRPTSTTSTTPSSAPRSSRTCSARSAATWRTPASRSRTPRASATSASTRSTSATRRAADGRRPRDLQERRQGDRLAARRRADVHRQVQRARGQLVPHPLLVLGRRREPVPRPPAGTGCSPLYESFIAGQIARTAELAYFFAPNVNSYKRFAYGSFAPTGAGLGRTTTAPARSARSATARACGWRAAAGRAATSTRTSRSRPPSRRASTASTAASSWARPSRATRTTPTRAARARQPARGDPRLLEGSAFARERVRRRGRRPLPERRPPGAAGLRGRRHRLGAAPWLRADVGVRPLHRASAPTGAGRAWARGRDMPAAWCRRATSWACRRPAASRCWCRPTRPCGRRRGQRARDPSTA